MQRQLALLPKRLQPQPKPALVVNGYALAFTLSDGFRLGFRLGLWREGCLVQNLAPGENLK
jgi:hypothetical protein